jgi:hypothetical protein
MDSKNTHLTEKETTALQIREVNNMDSKNTHLTEKETTALSIKIARLLNNVPIGQARYILNETKNIIDDGHLVDTGAQRFKMIIDELEE